MVKTKEELLNAIKEKIGDDSSDESLSFIEDISDTYDDLNNRITQAGDWKQKYEDNDKEWRQKYKDRFFSGKNDPDPEPFDDPEPEPKVKNFEDLFTFS